MRRVLCGDEWMSLCKNEYDTTYVEMSDAVLVVPVTAEGEVMLITEPSPAFGERVLVVVSGAIEAGEDSAMAANRELQEEIGFRAAKLTPLGELRPVVKYVRTCQFVFLAQEMAAGKLNGDEGDTWVIEMEKASIHDFETLIASGRLRDSSSIAALYMARSFLEKQATSG